MKYIFLLLLIVALSLLFVWFLQSDEDEKTVQSEDTFSEAEAQKGSVTTTVATTTLTTPAGAEALPAARQKAAWQQYEKPDTATLQASLSPLAYRVTQEEGTERAGTSALDKHYERGIYVDILSGEPLFSSRDKYDSKTGWPSFTAPIYATAVTEHTDYKLILPRTEVRSTIADNHLGHVFTDGPKDRGGLRYCINGVALEFVPEAEMIARGYGEFMTAL